MSNNPKFDKSEFLHVDLVEVPGSQKRLPLCNLMNNGRCVNGILLLITEKGELEWEGAPNIPSCAACEYHSKNCERC